MNCGSHTFDFCYGIRGRGCRAGKRVPHEKWLVGQSTPYCHKCEEPFYLKGIGLHGVCKYCSEEWYWDRMDGVDIDCEFKKVEDLSPYFSDGQSISRTIRRYQGKDEESDYCSHSVRSRLC